MGLLRFGKDNLALIVLKDKYDKYKGLKELKYKGWLPKLFRGLITVSARFQYEKHEQVPLGLKE